MDDDFFVEVEAIVDDWLKNDFSDRDAMIRVFEAVKEYKK